MEPCTWTADVFATMLSKSDCKGVIAMCSTSKECTRKCAEVFDWPEFPEERRKAAFNCVIHDIFDILREDIQKTFPPGWEWVSHNALAFEEFLRAHDDARDLDENDVAYIKFDEEGSGFFHVIQPDEGEPIIATVDALFGEHPREWVAPNELEFVEYPYCESFAARFAETRNLHTIRTQDQGHEKILFCRYENVNVDVLLDSVASSDSDILRYSVDQHKVLHRVSGSVKYHDYFRDRDTPSIRWVASGPQHIVVLWNEGEDELSVNVQVRHARLRNMLTVVFLRYGCSILYDDASDDEPFGWTVFKIPELELEELPRTRRFVKRDQRRHFLTSFPFLVCDVASPQFDRYIDYIPASPPTTFADAIRTRRYEDPSVATA